MRFAYADPPYLGCGRLYAKNHPEARVWDDPKTHQALIERLYDEYPDGWALSASAPSLDVLRGFLRPGYRVAIWSKPFAIFKPGVNPAYTWEPIVFVGGRKRDRSHPTVRDHIVENITLRKGLTGAKPEKVCRWIMCLLGADPTQDQFEDLFPGTGVFGATWAKAALA